MKLTDLFIRRPVLAMVVNLIILLAGFTSIRTLNVREYPKSDISVITVTTPYVGADADLVRGFITTPIEHAISSADGIDYIESNSAQGASTISVHLKLNYDINAALTQIQAKIAQVRNDLPPEAEAPEIEATTADSQFASAYLSFYSKDLDQNQITDFLTRVVQPKLTAINGVQKADILGARVFAMRIWLKPDRMAALGISPGDVSRALASNNYLSALGATKGSMISVNLVANTNLTTPEEFRHLVVKQANGAVVRLSDIADVDLGAENYDQEVRFNGQGATFVGIWVLPTANALDVIKAVRTEMPEIQRLLPTGMYCDVAYDSTTYIQNAINEVIKTLVETLLIVVFVIYLFLGSLRAILIPIVAIPVSLVGAAFLMLMAGFTINLLTLLAIVLAVGLVVDDAIVVVENVERHLHDGESPFQAAISAARELVGPIIAMTITLAAVYAPIGIQGGLTGALFREFAFTLAGAVIVSGVVALTLSPMMGSRLLRAGDSSRGYAAWVNRFFESFRKVYLRLLNVTLANRPLVYMGWIFVSLLMVPFYMISSKDLAPPEDQGVVFGIVQTSANPTLDQTLLFTQKVNQVFQSFPEHDHTFEIINPTTGFSGMGLKPWSERKKTADQLKAEVGAQMAKIPGVQVFPATPAALPGGSNYDVEFVIASTAEAPLFTDLVSKLLAKAMASKVFLFADTDLKYDQPQYRVVFDRDKVRSLGVDLSQVGGDLSTMLGGNYINRFNIQGRSYKVIPQVKRGQRLNAEQLENMYVTGPNGKLVQLSTFASLKAETVPRSLNRFQQLNSATIQGVLAPGISEDQGLRILEDEAAKILPPGFVMDYSGKSRQLRVEGDKLMGTLALSAILIFLVLSAQFESFRDPFIILAGSVPLAISGALMFSFFGFTSINIYSQVGLITLVGLVSKNGILIVEFANKLQEAGRDKWTAVTEAASIRLRPILMTSMAMIAGNIPLMIANGPGAGARNSLGIILVSGMVVGTAFTLLVVPAIYMLISKPRKVPAGSEPSPEHPLAEPTAA